VGWGTPKIALASWALGWPANCVENRRVCVYDFGRNAARDNQMSVDALLDRLLAMSAGREPIDVSQIRKDIHAEFDAATTVRERVALLGAHKAVCDMIGRP
jgi:hypothetical protein